VTGTARGATIDASISLARIGPNQIEKAVDLRAADMKRLGVRHGVLIADRRGQPWHPDAVNIDFRSVAPVIARYRETFSGGIGIDPSDGTAALRNLRAAIDDGFVVAHIVPHAFGLAPDAEPWYPTYALCADLGIPVQVELGVHRSPGARVRSVGRPIALDAVACDFPELKIIALSPWPWVEEAISVAYKHPHVYLAVGGDDPGSRDPSMARFADSWGRGKVMFASSGSRLEDSMSTVDSFDLRPESLDRCLEGVATEVFGVK
jgi:predicted TIM-barrel fold metal-dependent hydrolase